MWGNFQKAPETEEEDKRVFGLSKKEKKKRLGKRGQTRPQEKKKRKCRNKLKLEKEYCRELSSFHENWASWLSGRRERSQSISNYMLLTSLAFPLVSVAVLLLWWVKKTKTNNKIRLVERDHPLTHTHKTFFLLSSHILTAFVDAFSTSTLREKLVSARSTNKTEM